MMKKLICLVGIGPLFLWMVLLSCASMPGPKTAITTSNVSLLQGKWSGWTTFMSFQDSPVITTLEFTNATVPLQGSITINFGTHDAVASKFPADAKRAGNLSIIEFNNGMISDQGTVIVRTGQDFLELTLHSGEKMKMKGLFYYYGSRGRVEFTKS